MVSSKGDIPAIRAQWQVNSRFGPGLDADDRSATIERVALVVLLRGVNGGGHRTFRPTTLAQQLKHLDAVNIGAAGTFVIRRPVTRAQLRAELARSLPFEAAIVICQGREIVRLIAQTTSRTSLCDPTSSAS
jgi:hypothetical protein